MRWPLRCWFWKQLTFLFSAQKAAKELQICLCLSVFKVNANSAGQGFWMSLECRGHLLDHPKTLWKTKIFYWFSESLLWIRKSQEILDLQPPPTRIGLRYQIRLIYINFNLRCDEKAFSALKHLTCLLWASNWHVFSDFFLTSFLCQSKSSAKICN